MKLHTPLDLRSSLPSFMSRTGNATDRATCRRPTGSTTQRLRQAALKQTAKPASGTACRVAGARGPAIVHFSNALCLGREIQLIENTALTRQRYSMSCSRILKSFVFNDF